MHETGFMGAAGSSQYQLDIDTFILFECRGFLATGRLSYDNHMNAVNLT
jgi:hypothetical protein